MEDKQSDWRLMGQEHFLAGADLVWRRYRRYPNNPRWDHDHCEFCGAKFLVGELPDVLHEGYCTLDEYRWICKSCFADFRDQFQWKVVELPTDA